MFMTNPAMIGILKDDGPSSKIQLTHSLLPGYIDPNNVSTKKRPFSTFNAQPFSHTVRVHDCWTGLFANEMQVDLILPGEIFDLVHQHLEENDTVLKSQYARVYMKLGEILTGDFFTEYVKEGNIMMLSEGRPLVDNIISLYEGVLRLELDRPTYERCGLQGTPIEDGGRKHQKARWGMYTTM
jgi:ribonucleases P/MRP protein subunit RPP40